MGLQLILGASGSGKSYELINSVIRESMENSNENYIMIVPEQFTLETQRQIVSMHPKHGVLNVDIVSFERLAYRVFEELNYKVKTILDDCGKLLLLRKVIEDCKDRLLLYGKDSRKFGFITEMKSVISEILQYDISERLLEEALEQTRERKLLNAKLHDIRIIYGEFRKAMGEEYATTEELLGYLCKVIPDSKMIKNSVIALDGYTGFTPLQLNLLELLMIYAKDVIATVTIPTGENYRHMSGSHELFNLSKETINKLLLIADKNGVVCKPDILMKDMRPVRYENDMIAYLEKYLFRNVKGACEINDGGVNIYEAFNPQSEINYVVYMIRKLVNEGYKYRDIAVVSGDSAGYGDVIRKVFELNGIKAFVDDKKTVLNNPLIQLIRASIIVSYENFSYDSVLRLLKSGLLDITLSDVDIMENYILEMGIRGATSYRNIWVGASSAIRPEEIEKLNGLRKNFYEEYYPLYKVLKSKDLKVRDAVKAIYEYIERLGVYEKLEVMQKEFEACGDYVYEKEFGAIYESVMNLFDKVVSLIGDEYITAEELGNVLDTGFEQIEIGVIPPILDSVTIGDIERTRLRDIKALFFIGVNDGIIPKNSENCNILSEFDRERLKELNMEFAPGKKENAYIQKFYLYLNMTKPSKRLFLSYTKFDFEGKNSGPSYLISNIEKMYSKLSVKKASDYPDLQQYLYVPSSGYDNPIETDKKLEAWVAAVLYGEELYGSVSRMERYVECPYMHFLQYGLRLSERKEYEVTAVDLGVLYHEVLRAVTKSVADSEYTFTSLPNDMRREIIREHALKICTDYKNTIMLTSEKNKYLLEKLTSIVDKTVWALGKQLECGDFEIEGFEMSFSPEKVSKELEIKLSNGGKITLNGRIDRIDKCVTEEDVIVKVIDYKTSEQKIDFTDIYYGLRMQLLVYMKAAMLIEQKKYNDKSIVPGAIFYNVLKDPIIKLEKDVADEEIEKLTLEEMRPVGFVNKGNEVLDRIDGKHNGKSYAMPVRFKTDGEPDVYSKVLMPEIFTNMVEHTIDKLKSIGEEIVGGNIEQKPYKKKTKTGCDYCKFASVCMFDYREVTCKYNELENITVEKFEVKQTGGA